MRLMFRKRREELIAAQQHEELIAALSEIAIEVKRIGWGVARQANTKPAADYHRELKKLVDVSRDVQGAAELLARWLALQLPDAAVADVDIPEAWKAS